jgi:catalase-peroxidase
LAGNQPAQLEKVLGVLEGIQKDFNAAQSGGKKVSLADLIVLAAALGSSRLRRNAGHAITVPFTPGRTDASQAQTDVASFAVLEPVADGFRNFQKAKYAVRPEELLVGSRATADADRAGDDGVVGGLRVMNVNTGARRTASSPTGGDAHHDFFVNLLDLARCAAPHRRRRRIRGAGSRTGARKWTPPAWTSSSARTPNCGPSRKSTVRGRSGEISADFVARGIK